MPASELGSHIELAIDQTGRFLPDQPGHSAKLLRYGTPNGVPFAFDRVTKTASCFWFPCDDRLKRAIEGLGFSCSLKGYEGKSKPGRHSNLDAIPEFKRQPVYLSYAKTAGDALKLASAMQRD